MVGLYFITYPSALFRQFSRSFWLLQQRKGKEVRGRRSHNWLWWSGSAPLGLSRQLWGLLWILWSPFCSVAENLSSQFPWYTQMNLFWLPNYGSLLIPQILLVSPPCPKVLLGQNLRQVLLASSVWPIFDPGETIPFGSTHSVIVACPQCRDHSQ